MKNQVSKFIALCAIVCGFAVTANAQEAGGNAKPATMTPEQRSEMRLNRLKTSLNLTDEQVPKVKALLDAETAARSSNDKQAMKDSHEKMTSEMSKILTPEQLTKYNQMVGQQKGKMHLNGGQPGN